MKNDFAKKVFLYKNNRLTKLEKEAFEKEMAKSKFIKEAAEGLMLMDEAKYYKGYNDYVSKIQKLEKKQRRTKIIKLIVASSAVAASILLIVFFNLKQQNSINPSKIAEKSENTISKPINNNSSSIDVKPTEPIKSLKNEKQDKEQIIEQKHYASSENVIVTDNKETNSSNDIVDRTKPTKPINFDKYLKENLKYPQNQEKTSISGIVVLSVEVKKDGCIGKIDIKKGLNNNFNKEAIRVVKKGPKWQPAMVNGNAVDGVTDIEIVFSY
ncbi:MAG: energy transducer TonB [Bacteroidales bacterium]|nr:energy transducer TonB [Bacteroidales bacterium]